MSLLSFLAFAPLLLVPACREDAESPAGPEQPPALEAAASILSFSGMEAGLEASCGLTSDRRAYCWGFNGQGQLGDGTTTDRSTPVAVAGGLHFLQLSAGFGTSCGVTTDHRAYCWGDNRLGELGDGTTASSPKPVAVGGGHAFSEVRTNLNRTCGLSYPDGRAYCWGFNDEGQLGNGTRDNLPHSTPILVQGSLTFSRITTGDRHTCGVTSAHKVYCWGLNKDGQLGDGTDIWRRQTPRLVVGGLSFAWVDAGSSYTCAITTDHRAFCWGIGNRGQRGDGSVTARIRTPRAVFGNHLFSKVRAGNLHTCGVTTTNQAWCWGYNADGELGDGSFTNRLTPHLVAGGLALNQVSSGYFHTCARTTAGVGYCWGRNLNGQLGNGTTNAGSTTPVAVN